MFSITEKSLGRAVNVLLKHLPKGCETIDFYLSAKNNNLTIRATTANAFVQARLAVIEVKSKGSFSVPPDSLKKAFKASSVDIAKFSKQGSVVEYKIKNKGGKFETVETIKNEDKLDLKPDNNLPESFLVKAAKIQSKIYIEPLFGHPEPDVLLKLAAGQGRIITKDHHHIVEAKFDVGGGELDFSILMPQSYMEFFELYEVNRAHITKSGSFVIQANHENIEYTFLLPAVRQETNAISLVDERLKVTTSPVEFPYSTLEEIKEDIVKPGVQEVSFLFDKGECFIKGSTTGREVSLRTKAVELKSGNFKISAAQMTELFRLGARILAKREKGKEGEKGENETKRFFEFYLEPSFVLFYAQTSMFSTPCAFKIILARSL